MRQRRWKVSVDPPSLAAPESHDASDIAATWTDGQATGAETTPRKKPSSAPSPMRSNIRTTNSAPLDTPSRLRAPTGCSPVISCTLSPSYHSTRFRTIHNNYAVTASPTFQASATVLSTTTLTGTPAPSNWPSPTTPGRRTTPTLCSSLLWMFTPVSFLSRVPAVPVRLPRRRRRRKTQLRPLLLVPRRLLLRRTAVRVYIRILHDRLLTCDLFRHPR